MRGRKDIIFLPLLFVNRYGLFCPFCFLGEFQNKFDGQGREKELQTGKTAGSLLYVKAE